MFCDNVIILSINFIKIHLKENSSAWVTETVAGDEENTSYIQVSSWMNGQISLPHFILTETKSSQFVILWSKVMREERVSFISVTFLRDGWCSILPEDGLADEKCDGRPELRLHSAGSQQAGLESTQHHLHLQAVSGWVLATALLCRYRVMWWCGVVHGTLHNWLTASLDGIGLHV